MAEEFPVHDPNKAEDILRVAAEYKKLTPENIVAESNEAARRAGKPDRWTVRDGEVVKIR